ncbi:MAG TPA: rod shape-determining protein MreD [Acidimicrobiales bacterium]|nr:rod shape-determining protein MreD [Acidimicrobiales bacterium]
MSGLGWARLAIVVVVGVVAQVSVLDQLVVLGAHPDLMVLLAAAAGLAGGPQSGAMVGFTVGLVADLFVDTPFGLSSLTFVIVGYAVGLLRSIPAGRELGSAQVAACVVTGAAGTLLYAVLGALAGQSGMLGHDTANAVLVVMVGSLVLAPIALACLRWVFSGGRARAGYPVPSGGSATA